MTETDFWQRFEETSRRSQTLSFDDTLCTDASLIDIDKGSVASLFQEERVQKQTWFHANMTPEELLEQLNLLQKGGLTYGAILCFGKNPSKWVEGAFTRCTFWIGKNRLEGWEDDQEFRGNLLEQYKLSIAFLQRSLRLSRVISAEGSVERWEIPTGVLREALVNALIHREYANQRDSVRVEIFDDRIEISSPGGLFGSLNLEQLGLEDKYALRNPRIVRIFYLRNYVDMPGAGIAYMQQSMEEAGLPEPQFDTDGESTFKVVLSRPQNRELHNDKAIKTPTVSVPTADFRQRSAEASLDKPQTLPFDHTLCRDAELGDIHMEAVKSLFQEERVQKQTWFHANMTPEELLEHLNLLQKEGLTYGAVLCFGENPSRWVEGAFARCISYKGNNRLEDREDDQEFHGNLLAQYELSIEFLQENLRVMSAEGDVEQWEILAGVLQEAVANALIHRDYTDQTDSVRVEIFDDRIEISSPGGLFGSLTLEQLGLEDRYALRNPRIARIFYLCMYRRNLGTGVAHMRRAMKEAGLPEPRFDINDGRTFKVVLSRPQQTEPRLITEPLLLPKDVESGQKGASPLLADGAEPDPNAQPALSLGSTRLDPKRKRPFSSERVGHRPIIRSSVLSRERRFVVKRGIPLLALLMIIVLVVALSLSVFPRLFPIPLGIGVVNEPNNEQVGLSDGTYAFDTGPDRADAALKVQAATKFAQGDKVGAMSLWSQAVGKNGIDTSDAEALIYQEDQSVLASHSPYITLVVGTMLGGGASNISTGRDDLQGAYVAQKEYNDGQKLSDGNLVRLLIANAGSNPDYVTEVAGQIVQAAKQDPTIVGVVGWAFSAYAQKANPVLTQAHIPLVSPTASADNLSGVSPYFFRVVPSNKSQAIAGAKYAEQQLHASRVALFVDPNNNYSNSLADDFEQQFVVADNNQIVDTEWYTIGDKAGLPMRLQNALKSNPDLIYFSGYADDLAVLLVNIPTSQPNLQVLGGDGLYDPNAYSSTAKLNFSRVRFTTFAYPDEWSVWGLKNPPFFSEYSADFNPADVDHNTNPYGFTRADFEAILSYDATFALLQGCQNVIVAGESLTAVNLRDGLAYITGSNAIQGIGGQISFDSHGDPMNKAIVILYVDQDNHIRMLPPPNGVQGCFLVGQCDTNLHLISPNP